MRKLLLVLIVLSIWATASANECKWNAAFHNTTNAPVVYVFYWIDHPYDYAGPVNLAGGELEKNGANILECDYTCGEYYVTWSQGDSTFHYAFSQREPGMRILEPTDLE